MFYERIKLLSLKQWAVMRADKQVRPQLKQISKITFAMFIYLFSHIDKMNEANLPASCST